MIPSAEYAAMQTAANAWLDQPCTVQRASTTPDGMGSTAKVWSAIYTTTARLAAPTGSLMQVYAELLGELDAWIVSLPASVVAQRYDRLLVEGQTLEVQHVFTPESYNIFTRVLATEVR